MKCVFLSTDGKCYAEMIAQRGAEIPWEVDEATKNDFCTQVRFPSCPRYEAKLAFATKSR